MRNAQDLSHASLKALPRLRPFEHFRRTLHLFYDDTTVPFDPNELPIHWAKHRTEFPAAMTMSDYEKQADALLSRQLSAALLECTRGRGDVVRYDTVTTEYVVRSTAGLVRTYFKPMPCSSIPAWLPKVRCHGYATNLDYFNGECLKW